MAEQKKYETLTIQKNENHVAEVVLNRPEKGNSLNKQLFSDLETAFDALDKDPEVRAIVLRGEGKSFCTGLDLMAAATDFGAIFSPGLAGDRLDLRKLIRALQKQTSSPRRCSKPVIAAVHGWCIGGGLDLIAYCDIRLCHKDAKFSLREGKVGMVADLGSLQALPPIIGEAATRELALTAKDVDAQTALRLGLVSQVLGTEEELLETARKEAARVASLSPLVTQAIKHLLNKQSERALEDGLQYVATWNSAFLQSEDLNEAFSAFLAKREPQYKGR